LGKDIAYGLMPRQRAEGQKGRKERLKAEGARLKKMLSIK